MSKRLVGVSIVKNEADIIEASVRHNLGILDHLLVFDHDSTDATRAILHALVEEGLSLTLVHLSQSGPAFKQALWTTSLANKAFLQYGADYVFPIDADEFVHVPSRQVLEDALNMANADVMNLHWQTYVVGSESERGHPLRLLRWRVETQRKTLPKIVLSRKVTELKDWSVGIGSHLFYRRVGDNFNWDAGEALPGMELAHLPLRSPEQLVAKALIGWMSFRLAHGEMVSATSNNWHLRELYNRILAGDVIGNADVRSYAIAMYVLGRMPSEADVKQIQVIEAPLAEPMPLRYTPDSLIDPARLVAAWSSSLIDRILRSPTAPVKSEPAA